MSGEDYRIRAVLSAEDKNMGSTFGSLFDQSGSLMERLKSGIGFGAMAKIGSSAISAVGGAFSSFATNAMNAGVSFESTMSEVEAISGATSSDMAKLADKAKEMGASTKFTASEAGDALKYMAMAGWKTTDMLDGLDGIMSLAAASGEDLGTTSDIVTDAMTAFGLKAKDSSHFADILASASSNANTNVSLLGESFKYVAPVAGSMGYKAEDVSVALGLMANAGIKGSQAGTALRTTLTNLVKPTDEMQAAMSDLGISLTDDKGKMKDLDTVMQELREAFSGLSEEQKAQYASTLAGKEGMSGLLAIVGAAPEDYNKLKSAIADCDGAAENMAATMQDNLGGKMTTLSSAMEGLGIAAYDHIKEPFSDTVDIVTQKVRDLTSSMENGGLGEAVENVGKTIKKTVKTTIKVVEKAVDFAEEHGETLIRIGGSVASAWTFGKATRNIANFTKGLTNTKLPLKIFSELAGSGMSKTDAFLGMLEGSSSGLRGFATSALNAGGGLKGIASAAAGMISPVGLAVAAVGALAGGIAYWAISNRELFDTQNDNQKKAAELRDTYDELSDSLESNRKVREESVDTAATEAEQAQILSDKLENLAGKENKSASEKAAMKSMVDQLNEVIPDLNLVYDDEADKLSKTTDEINNKIDAMRREAEVAAFREAQASITKDMASANLELYKAEESLAQMQEDEAAAYDTYMQKMKEWKAAGTGATEDQMKAANDAGQEWRKCRDATAEASSVVDDYKSTISGLQDEYDAMGAKASQMTAKEGWDNLVKEAQNASIEIPEALKDGIESGKMMIPESIDELNSLIEWDRLSAEAEEQGIQIPDKLARGIANGTAEPAEAVETLKAVMDPGYQALIQQAAQNGIELPSTLAEGIRTGSIDPVQAKQELDLFLGDYSTALSAAQTAGVSIPNNLQEGVLNGTIPVSEAVSTLNACIEFQKAAEEAGLSGTAAAENLATGIRTGAYDVSDACEMLSIIAGKGLSDTSGASKAGAANAQSYASGAKSATGQVTAAAKGLANSGVKGLDNARPYNQAGAKAGSAYASGMKSKTGDANSAGSSVKNAGVSGTSGGFFGAYENGSYIGSGFAAGMKSQLQAVRNAADLLVQEADRAVRAKAKIQSPSKVFRKLGGYVGEGFTLGISDNFKEAARAANQLVHLPSAQFAYASDGHSLSGSGAVSITTVIELDGREVARGTSSYMSQELAQQRKVESRLKGVTG